MFTSQSGSSLSYFFALALIFARSRSEKCFKHAESPTEALATQAILKSSGAFGNAVHLVGSIFFVVETKRGLFYDVNCISHSYLSLLRS